VRYKDYYKIMGVSRDASQDDIKKAYRRLARKYHPDVSKEANAEQLFKDLGEAYAVLKDPEKRAAYDGLGSGWNAGQEFRPPPNWDSSFHFEPRGFSTGDPGAFSDFFESLFGGGAGRGFDDLRQPFNARGQDHQATVMIDVEDAYHDSTRSISLRVPDIDSSGFVNTRERRLNVRIPKGVHKGQRIRLPGQGAPGAGNGKAGDLYLDIDFNPHPLYRVDGKDVYLDLPLTPWEAALGATINIPTPDGLVDLRIPPGTGNGKKLRLRNRGIPGQPPGDLYVVATLTLPPAADDKSGDLYRRMRDEMPYNPRKHLEGYRR
jgi:curved DNA-binding protein